MHSYNARCLSLILCSRLIIAECLWSGLNVINNCESSAYIMQSRPWVLITSSNGAKYRINSYGPSTEPCATLVFCKLSIGLGLSKYRFLGVLSHHRSTVPVKPYLSFNLFMSISWSIVSKAVDRSRSTRITSFFWSIVLIISLWTRTRAVSVL